MTTPETPDTVVNCPVCCGKGDIPRIRSGMVGFCGARDLCWPCRGSGKMTAETAEKHKLWAKERGGK